jgi:hypothetical protein
MMELGHLKGPRAIRTVSAKAGVEIEGDLPQYTGLQREIQGHEARETAEAVLPFLPVVFAPLQASRILNFFGIQS